MLNRLSRGSPLKTLLFYTVLMVTVPISAFFVAQWTMGHWFDMSVTGSSIGATIISVLCVHVILALFVYEAYHEDFVGSAVTVAQKED